MKLTPQKKSKKKIVNEGNLEVINDHYQIFEENKPKNFSTTLSDIHKQDIISAFNYYDSNNKGYLTQYEYKLSFISLMGYRPTKYERLQYEKLDKLQFIKRMVKRFERKDEYEEMKSIFNIFDESYKGFLTLSDVKRGFKSVASFVPNATVEHLFYEFDSHKNGRVVLTDFLEMMKISKKKI